MSNKTMKTILERIYNWLFRDVARKAFLEDVKNDGQFATELERSLGAR